VWGGWKGAINWTPEANAALRGARPHLQLYGLSVHVHDTGFEVQPNGVEVGLREGPVRKPEDKAASGGV
jgi:hypothetical protein